MILDHLDLLRRQSLDVASDLKEALEPVCEILGGHHWCTRKANGLQHVSLP
jgi:hypothetical protein